jgi:protein-L-isoaspartate(D-aspartate) O-methyltransferase
LLNQARGRFQELKLHNIHCHYSDGSWGWEENAPYDGIIVTAAPEDIPEALLKQLAPGGRLIIPVGARESQELVMLTQTPNGFVREILDRVSFVPMLMGKE